MILSSESNILGVFSGGGSLDSHSGKIHQLTNRDQEKVLAFLASRPVHTVFIAGFIYENGIESSFNRGTFYAYYDKTGELEGVALIGHAILLEAHSDAALAAFARLAQQCSFAHMVLGNEEMISRFLNYFSQTGQLPRHLSREILFEQRVPIKSLEPVTGLRLGRPDDIDILLPVYAAMVMEESGRNPLETDPAGFKQRWLRRIEQNRVWVWIEKGQLIFNLDVISETPDVIYVEGVYVNPEERGKGYGLRCLSQLCNSYLERVKSVCLLSNEHNHRSHHFFRRAGFQSLGNYDSAFLHGKN
jgi:predicted GNAT family acetyltransferase